jgi:5-methylcytosine-specific restriction endonuclease McrA
MEAMNSRVLLLNNTYEAINVCSVKRALKLIFKGAAVIEEKNDGQIFCAERGYSNPSVIRLVNYVNLPYRTVMLSRKNVFLRDNFSCQYCGNVFEVKDLTLDHICPQSKGGKTTWENVVTACKKCNGKKGDKFIGETGMRLLRKPTAPACINSMHIFRHIGRDKKSWDKYVFN